MPAELSGRDLASIGRLVDALNSATEGDSPPAALDDQSHRFLRRFHRIFADLCFATQAIAGDGDDVLVYVTASGRHVGDFRGIAPTGRQIELPGTIAVTLAEGEVREARYRPTQLDIRRQLEGEHEAEVPWYKQYGGGAWDLHGRQQLDFLVGAGLEPHHHLLDIGCGTLRGGVKLIPYLDPGHYWGVESNADALAGAHEAIAELGLERQEPHLVHLTDFDFGSLNQRFDYYLAYSVFTELPLNAIMRCVANVDRTLEPGATFYATFWENPDGMRNLEPIAQVASFLSYFDEYPYHYDFATFESMCERTGLSVEYLGDWCGVGPQKVIAFTRREP